MVLKVILDRHGTAMLPAKILSASERKPCIGERRERKERVIAMLAPVFSSNQCEDSSRKL